MTVIDRWNAPTPLGQFVLTLDLKSLRTFYLYHPRQSFPVYPDAHAYTDILLATLTST
jgi:hypothetical protein